MSEERIRKDEELKPDEATLSSEDLEKIAGGLAEEASKIANREDSRKTNT